MGCVTMTRVNSFIHFIFDNVLHHLICLPEIVSHYHEMVPFIFDILLYYHHRVSHDNEIISHYRTVF